MVSQRHLRRFSFLTQNKHTIETIHSSTTNITYPNLHHFLFLRETPKPWKGIMMLTPNICKIDQSISMLLFKVVSMKIPVMVHLSNTKQCPYKEQINKY